MDGYKIILIPLYVVLVGMIAFLVYVVSIPFWSDSKKVCEYWEKQNREIVCIKETTYFCLEKECSLGSDIK